jgi:hypothetical protein
MPTAKATAATVTAIPFEIGLKVVLLSIVVVILPWWTVWPARTPIGPVATGEWGQRYSIPLSTQTTLPE